MEEVTIKKDFSVKIGEHEGPLDLILNLIEKRKLLINEISLSQITDDYISHLKNSENTDMANNAHFILIASTLLLIKSKSLLPGIQLTTEETSSIEDLERRLKLLEKFRSLGDSIQQMFCAKPIFFANDKKNDEKIFAPAKNIVLAEMPKLILNLVQVFPKVEKKLPEVSVKKIVSLEEMIDRLTKRIQGAINMSFKEFAGVGKAEKVDVIVSFLALLELVKQGTIHVRQQAEHDDIFIETKDVGVPKYS